MDIRPLSSSDRCVFRMRFEEMMLVENILRMRDSAQTVQSKGFILQEIKVVRGDRTEMQIGVTVHDT